MHMETNRPTPLAAFDWAAPNLLVAHFSYGQKTQSKPPYVIVTPYIAVPHFTSTIPPSFLTSFPLMVTPGRVTAATGHKPKQYIIAIG